MTFSSVRASSKKAQKFEDGFSAEIPVVNIALK
jgi:hypothetical protein